MFCRWENRSTECSGNLFRMHNQVTACSGLRARPCVSRAEALLPTTVIETEREREQGMQERVSHSRAFLKCLRGTKLPGRAKRTFKSEKSLATKTTVGSPMKTAKVSVPPAGWELQAMAFLQKQDSTPHKGVSLQLHPAQGMPHSQKWNPSPSLQLFFCMQTLLSYQNTKNIPLSTDQLQRVSVL